MRNLRSLLGDESGVALVLALMMLLTLTGLLLAFLSVSALEPQISRNLADTARARYLAEAGIEIGFNMMVAQSDGTYSFSQALAGASSSAPWRPLVTNGTLANVTSGGSAAEATFAGTYSVIVRNDYQAGDPTFTGVANGAETLTTDVNKIVIMRSTGTFNGATKTIEVVMRRAQLPPFPGAVNLPGVQSDTFINMQNFNIDGRDYACSANCDTAANWTQNTSNPNKFGVAVQPGTQSNVGITYESNVQAAVGTSSSCNTTCSNNKKASIKGRSQTGDTASYATGLSTIATDTSLSSSNINAYIDAVRTYSGTTVLQSTQACPMVISTGSSPSTPNLSNGCTGAAGVNQPLDLGNRDNPKLVFFKGDVDTSSQFTGLKIAAGTTIKGAGILIVEDGDFSNLGNLEWDGVVIVTGSYVGSGFRSGSDTRIRGAFVANEEIPGEASGFFEFLLDSGANSFNIQNSKQNIDMVNILKANHTLTNWREL
jgi:Tfp pilus assembly protein PilX